MAKKTRLGSAGFGTRRVGSFAGKTPSVTGRTKFTRLGSAGFNTRRVGSFAGKTPSATGTQENVNRGFMVNVGRMMGVG